MADHSELVAEIPLVEKMSTGERLKHAKKRRALQLKKFSQYEKQIDKENNKRKKSQGKNTKMVKRAKSPRVTFVNNIMLLEAAARNDVKEVESLLRKGVSSDVTNEDGLTALHQCCIDDQEELLMMLLNFGANVNAQDSELWTPLHAAATCGHVHLCKMLINQGAELLAVNADGNMPYDICEDDITLDFIESEMAKRGITQELIDDTRLSTERKMLDDLLILTQPGFSLNYCGRTKETLLHIAAANGYMQVAEFLIKQHVDINSEDEDQWQPIHAAACWGHMQILELLVEHGADLEARTKSGESPLDICEDPELRQRILEMRDEIKTHRSTKPSHLKRRRSQNTRSGPALYNSNSSLADKVSASIRRSSMREKMPIALKEAREEAQRLRESTASADENDDDGETDDNSREIHLACLEEFDTHRINTQLEMVAESAAPEDVRLEGHAVPRHVPEDTDPPHQTCLTEPADPSTSSTPLSSFHISQEDTSIPTKSSVPLIQYSSQTGPCSQVLSDSATTSTVKNGITLSKDDALPDSLFPQELQPQIAQSELSATPLSGTLSDLKKMRAQKFQDAYQFKDSSNIYSDTEDHNLLCYNSDAENNIMLPENHENINEPYNGLHKNMAYISSDPPKRKFTASNSEIIGGNESKTNCCILL